MLPFFRKPRRSPNFGERKGNSQPNLLILHYTGMESAEAALERLCDPKSEVSAHYLIERNGKIHELVDEDKRAWHAGVSSWAGETDINSHSIGIEIVNPGHEFGYSSFSDKQVKQAISLCKIILERWGIKASEVLGHSDVAPERKVDPGHLFPWEKLVQEGIGLWPQPNEMDYQAAEDVILNSDTFHELLVGYGYDAGASYEGVSQAFMRHFQPEKFERWDDKPEPDMATAARLLALIRAKHELKT